MSGLKLDSATIGSLNTCTSYPPCSNPFPKVKVISGSSSTINIFLGAKPPRYFTILLFLLFPFYPITNFLQTQTGQQLLPQKLLTNTLHGTLVV